MSGTETYVVVYQFGKVASTSLVATLNELPGVEAVQSHFLGANAFRKMVGMLLSPDTNDYFFEHGIKQFEQNVRINRRMDAIMTGRLDARLVVVTLARDPMQWFRSAVTQAIDGYLPAINATADHFGFRDGGAEARVEAGMRAILEVLCRTIVALGGVEPTMALTRERKLDLAAVPEFPDIPGLNAIFYLCLRPFDWFGSHYEMAMATPLDALEKKDGFWHGKRPHTDLVVLRYEDIDQVLLPAMQHVGLALDSALKRENVSQRKRFDKAVRAAFESGSVQTLAAQFEASRYCRFFGYAEAATADAAPH